MILLLARNQEVDAAIVALQAEGFDRREIIVSNPKYPGALDRIAFKGERFAKFIVERRALACLPDSSRQELYGEADEKGIRLRTLDTRNDVPEPDPAPKPQAKRKTKVRKTK